MYKNIYPLYNIIYPVFKNKQDADEIEFLKKTIKPGFAIMDIGANIGFYSKILSNLTGNNGKVHSFEPDKTNFRHLKANTKNLSNLVLNNQAVSENTQELKIYRSKDLNVDHRTYPIGDYESIETINAVSIDDYVNGAYKVDFIKMDIQGFEVSALKGMEKTVATNPDIKLLLEFWPHGLHEAGSSVEAFYKQIVSMDLAIRFMEKGVFSDFDPTRIPEYETWTWGMYKNILITQRSF